MGNLEFSVITGAGDKTVSEPETFSIISLSSSHKHQDDRHSRLGDLPRTNIKKIERKKYGKSHHGRRRKISWQNVSGQQLEDSNDSMVKDINQCFLYSSHPRIVDTISPVSPS